MRPGDVVSNIDLDVEQSPPKVRSNISINMAEDSVVVTLVNQVSEDLGGVVHAVASGDSLPLEDDGMDHGESASESEVEVEQVLADDNSSVNANDEAGNGSMSNITFDVRKRTLIMLWQRTILEEFYKAGMTSASMQLHSMHLAAAEKTGLDSTVIKNWIRNRRRPAAVKSAERLQERISQGDLNLGPQPSFTIVPTQAPPTITTVGVGPQMHRPVGSSATPPTAAAAGTTTVFYPVNSAGLISTQPVPQSSHTPPSIRHHLPEAKRACHDQSTELPIKTNDLLNCGSLWSANGMIVSATSHVSSSFSHTSQPISSPTTQQSHPLTTAPPTSHLSSSPALLVKLRVFQSGETDFYETEISGQLTYENLLKSCAEELEVQVSQVAKIRKLPNILIRRDRDVLRLQEGQELEVVLKETTASTALNGSMIINPLAAAGNFGGVPGAPNNSLPVMNLQIPDPSSIATVNSIGLHQNSHMNGLP